MINLTKEFYNLIDEGFIYDEDENGLNMSYGEYDAIATYLWELVEDELKGCQDIEEAYDCFNEIMETADDDTKMFMNYTDEDLFEFDVDYEDGTYEVIGECPDVLKPFLDEFLKDARYNGLKSRY